MEDKMELGITAFGGYIPRLRLRRESIAGANSWVDPSLSAQARSERSMCDVDEDSITMAVEAARDCLNGIDREDISSLYFASTTAPFDDRQNSAVIAEALKLREDITSLDVSHSQRAGTSGLITALMAATADVNGTSLYVAADHRQAKSATLQELLFGDGAAAITLGTTNVIANFLGSQTLTRDLVDHFRGQGSKYDYQWEERWVREEGYFKMVPDAIRKLFAKCAVSAAQIDHFVMPCLIRGVREKIAHKMEFAAEAVRDNLLAGCGETGTAHPLVMLVDALQDARPGQKILVIGFGQGVDALLFETTDRLSALASRTGIKGALANGTIEKNYQKFLSFNDRVDIEWGMRAEAASKLRLTTAYRDRKMFLALTGGKCKDCGTVQFPAAHICVNPDCRAIDSQAEYSLVDSAAKIASYTVDWLAYSPNPPLIFGMVEFEEGAKLMMQMTGFDPDDVEVGIPVKMVFRIKSVDKGHNFRTYFWKAAPQSN
jgi:3-hydroxy-3-methylglutaryl CoA synthase